MYYKLMRAYFLFIFFVLMCLSSVCVCAESNYSIMLNAHPEAIVADSLSSTTITAEVRDSSGRNVPDGTLVEFSTSLGIIERNARTTAGTVRVRLESGNTVGTAVVSALVANGQAVAKLNVDFLAPGTEMFDESFISVESDKYLGYDVKKQVVDSAGGVRIYSRGLSIEAEEAQIDAKTNILRAKGSGSDIVISRGDKKVLASQLYYDFNSMTGVLFAPAVEGAKRMLFRGRDLFIEEDQDPKDTIKFEFEPVSESSMYITARSILIRPGQDLKIKRASYYLDGDKIPSPPLTVVPLRGGGTGINQMLTYGTDGLRLDVPLYYSLSAHGTGAVRVKHSEPTQWGYYSGRSGWQADIEQQYNFGGSVDGSFSLNRVNSASEWGARWSHRMQFNNNSQVYSFLEFPSHKNLYGTLDYRHSLKDYTFTANFRGNMLQNASDRYSGAFGIQTRAKPLLGDAISYALTTRLAYSNYYNRSQRIGNGLGLQLYGKPLMFRDSSSITTSMNVSRDWGQSSSGTSIFANAGYYRGLGNIGQFGLNYSYSWGNSAYSFLSQRLSADLSLRPSIKWDSRFYVTRELDDGSTSAFGEFNYSFLPTWRLGLNGTYQRFTGSVDSILSDYEMSLSKQIGSQQACLIWSHSRGRFRLEFNALQF